MELNFGDILGMVFLHFGMSKARLMRFRRRISEQIDACRSLLRNGSVQYGTNNDDFLQLMRSLVLRWEDLSQVLPASGPAWDPRASILIVDRDYNHLTSQAAVSRQHSDAQKKEPA